MHSRTPSWDANDAAIFRQFLATTTGQRFRELLTWLKPPSGVDNPTEITVSLQLGRVQGYDDILANLFELTAGRDRPPTNLTTD